MISDKRRIHGAIPDLAPLLRDELIQELVRLQGERVTLVAEAAELRDVRDRIAADLVRAKLDAEARALVDLPAGRGKDAPAATAIKSFVDADAAVIAATGSRADAVRDLARVDDDLGAVRSALRVVGAALSSRITDLDLGLTERKEAWLVAASLHLDRIHVAEAATTDEDW